MFVVYWFVKRHLEKRHGLSLDLRANYCFSPGEQLTLVTATLRIGMSNFMLGLQLSVLQWWWARVSRLRPV